MNKHPVAGVRRRNKIAGQFSARTIKMMESVAFRVLSHSARRVLDRLEIEHAHHGGQDNGRLPVTFNDFVNFNIDRHAIAPAVREVEALGFARVTERGTAGNADFRSPNKFALTYRATKDAPASDDWNRIKTIEEAQAVARAARKPIRRPPKKNRKPVGVSAPFRCGDPTPKMKISSGENPHYRAGAETPTTSISRDGDGVLAPMSAFADGDEMVKPAVALKRRRRQ
jgi:hypothetical protein